MNLNVVFIGAGNLATNLSVALKNKGFNILQVFSRTESSAKILAEKLNTNYTVSAEKILLSADIFFIALKDSAFEEILQRINFRNKLIVHSSGTLSISALKNYSSNFGVLYPLQTFSKQRELNFRNIPVFIEANSEKNKEILLNVACEISDNVSLLDSEKRKYLHIAAVFACNFVNHFYMVASEILKSKNIPFEVLRPLILETAQKVQEMNPKDAQTGPALRFDENIITDHIKELNEIGEIINYATLYNSISKSIFEFHQKNKE